MSCHMGENKSHQYAYVILDVHLISNVSKYLPLNLHRHITQMHYIYIYVCVCYLYTLLYMLLKKLKGPLK